MDQINKAIEVLNAGGVILYTSDTVCGLGCLTDHPKAIDKIYQIKKRDLDQKLILLIGDDKRLNKYVKEVPEVAWDLIDYAEKQPTIIYPNARNLPEILIEKDRSIAIRVIKTEPLQTLLNKINTPLTSTSANISGANSPRSIKEVSKEILSKVDFILDLPQIISSNSPSSIIKLQTNGEVKIIRK